MTSSIWQKSGRSYSDLRNKERFATWKCLVMCFRDITASALYINIAASHALRLLVAPTCYFFAVWGVPGNEATLPPHLLYLAHLSLTRMHTHTHTHTHTHIYYTYMYTHTHTHIYYTYMYTHTHSALWWMFYGGLFQRSINYGAADVMPIPLVQVFCAVTGSVMASILTNPLDVIRTRYQVTQT